MKKIISLLLVALMLVSMIPTAMAAAVHDACGNSIFEDCSACGSAYYCSICEICATCGETYIGGNWKSGTVVTYNADATATEYYTVTVPSALDPGDNGTVTAEGNFPSNQTLKITADTSIGLTDGISTKTLGVSFTGIELVGSNTAAVSASNSVAVANWSNEVKAPLFGEWKGTFNYYAEVVEEEEAATIITFTIDGVEYQAEEGMTWEDWVYSDEYSHDNIVRAVDMVTNLSNGNNIAYADSTLVHIKDDIISDYSYIYLVEEDEF